MLTHVKHKESPVRNVVAVLVLVLVVASAQDAAGSWQQKLGFELLLNEGYYSSNWVGNEQTSGSVTAMLGHSAARQLSGKVKFEHELGLAFGQLLSHDSLSDRWQTSKSEDKVRLDDVLRFTLGLWVDPLVSFRLKSQFIDGRNTPTKYLNPIELLETGGVGRRFCDDSTRALTSQIGAAARQVFDRDTTAVADAGVSWITAFRHLLFSRDAEYTTKLVAYKPLLAFSSGAELGTWPVLDWEHAITARFNKALSGKVYVQVLFDETVHASPRLKQTLGMGLSLAWQPGT